MNDLMTATVVATVINNSSYLARVHEIPDEEATLITESPPDTLISPQRLFDNFQKSLTMLKIESPWYQRKIPVKIKPKIKSDWKNLFLMNSMREIIDPNYIPLRIDPNITESRIYASNCLMKRYNIEDASIVALKIDTVKIYKEDNKFRFVLK